MGNVKLSELEPRHIHALYSRLACEEGASGSPLSYATRREVHVTLKMALKQALRCGLVKRNVAEMVDPPKGASGYEEDGDGEARVLTDDEARRFFQATRGKRWHHYYVAAIRTSLRPGELLGLRWDGLNLDADPGSLKVRRTLNTHSKARFGPPKSDAARRTVALHWEAAEAFAAKKAMLVGEGRPTGPKGLVFLDERDAYELGQPQEAQPQARPGAGGPVGVHPARAAPHVRLDHAPRVARLAVDRPGDARHESITMTMGIYGHLFPGAQEDAIRALAKMNKRPESGGVAVG